MNPLVPVELKTRGLTLRGFSRSGLATWLHVPEIDAVFDLGECPLEVVKANRVFITHGHDDHVRCLTRHMSMRELFGLPPATYYVPEAIQSEVVDMIDVDHRLGNLEGMPFHYFLGGDGEHDRTQTTPRHWVNSFRVDHRVAALGYTIYGEKKSLKPEWVGCPETEIATAARAGREVSESREVALLTFIGDHTATALALDHVWQSDALVVETTFLDGEVSEARMKGHTHLSELVSALEAREPREKQTLVLKHFSMRYSEGEIRDLAGKALPAKWAPHTQLLI